MNNEITAAIAAAVEAYEGSKQFVITAVKRQIRTVNVACRNPWKNAQPPKTLCIL